MFAETPEPPYYAVIFTSKHSGDLDGYAEELETISALAMEQPGFLGIESARSEEGPDGVGGIGITVSYYDSLDAIDGWRQNVDHQRVKAKGRARWYEAYTIRIARVESDKSFVKEE